MKSRNIVIKILIASLLLIGCIIFYFLTKKDKNTTLTIIEKQWIEQNKNNAIDLSIVNNVPVFNSNGSGVIFDFISSLENATELNFNKLSYEVSSTPASEYAFQIVDKVEDNQLLVYEDNFVLVTKENIKYNRLNEIPALNIGVLDTDIKNVKYYLNENKNLTYVEYKNQSELLKDFADEKKNISAIAVPKNLYLKEIVENSNYNISYNISDMKKFYVLKLGSEKKLNKIITKYFKKWNRDNYEESYNTNFSNSYFTYKQVYEQDKANFRSKRYSYGFINYAPYDLLINERLVGINYELIKGFARLADIEISYDSYKNYNELLKAYNNKKIDMYFNGSSLDKSSDSYETVAINDGKIVVLSKINNPIIINSIESLKNYDVISIENSKIVSELENNMVNVKTFNNVNSLLRNKKKNDVIVIDKVTYDTYMYNKLRNYKIDYMYDIDNNYTYILRDNNSNKIFNEYYDFYLSFVNMKDFENKVDYSMFEVKVTDNKPLIALLLSLILLVIIITGIVIYRLKPKKTKKDAISKEDKLKYIDMLTSLKNRNYLNDSMEKWDNSEIYPQAIVIVDLNNVAYINDNYGHEEGDNLIKDAAAILIKTQLENTEIMRTNGNEFLIYMVEYQEKQVVSYIRKLNKEFKELNHGFGAALGYSIITDQLKTIDDAVNEATLDMKNNKEEIQG